MASAADDLVEQAHQGRREHRYDDARQLLIKAVAIGRESGVPLDLAKALTALGQIERDLHLPAASATAAVADCLDPRRAVPGPRYRHLLPLCSAFDSAFLDSGGRSPNQAWTHRPIRSFAFCGLCDALGAPGCFADICC